MNYRGILTITETKKFFDLFFELEVSRMTIIHQRPIENGTKIEIFLSPFEVATELLEASFKDGLLCSDGWSEKFEKDDDYETIMNHRLLTGKST